MRYPQGPQGGPRGPPGPPGPGAGGQPGGNPNYFTDTKKGEVNELLNLLRQVSGERENKRKREIVKKVIAYMTLGIDVSRLFSEMVKCVDTKDIILKKMVYLYLTNYANKNSELAIMCINTLLNDCRNEDPMVRGLALRSLCSLRLDSILEYIHDPLNNSLTDSSAYVRKTGVMGILKVFSLNPDLIRETDLIDTLYNMIKDRDPQVVQNCIEVLSEIMMDEGGMAVNQQIIWHVINRLAEFNEWGQCTILKLISTYQPANEEEMFNIMNALEQCLRVSNSAVIIGTAKCFLLLTENLPDIHAQVYARLRQPLLTLMAGGSHELNYVVLQHINTMVKRCSNVFNPDFRQFYARYNEPTYVKYVKVDILSHVADERNVGEMISELSEYVTGVDQEMARRSIRSIAKIAVSLEESADQIFDTLIDFLEMDMDYVRAQTMIVMKDLLRKYPENRHDVLPLLPKLMKDMEESEGRCAMIWMIGEYGEDLRRGPYVLEPLIDNFSEETSIPVLLELLSASMKLFFKRPPEMQGMLGRLLEAATIDTRNQDLHDRALLYYRLLEQNVQAASNIVSSTKDPINVFAEMVDNDIQEKLFYEFNSLAIVYEKPSETFIQDTKKGALNELEDEEYEDDHEENHHPGDIEPQYQHREHEPPHQESNVTGGGIDLLDMNFSSSAAPPPPVAPSPGLQLSPSPVIDPNVFQQKWGSLGISGNLQIQLQRVPGQADIENFMNQCFILTMASGDVGAQLKYFFYAQDIQGGYYLSETILDKVNYWVTATIKSDNQSMGQEFALIMEHALQSLL